MKKKHPEYNGKIFPKVTLDTFFISLLLLSKYKSYHSSFLCSVAMGAGEELQHCQGKGSIMMCVSEKQENV